MDRRVVVLGLLLLALTLLTSACGSKQTQPVEPGMPNPASVYCKEQGGELEIRTGEDGGQVGICVFADGSECEEWAFYRGECQAGGENAGVPNPASVYCKEQGGELEIRTGEDGGQVGICVFADGSECEEWAFYRGECQAGGENAGVPNPASVYCKEQGGELEIRTGEDGGQVGICVFADGSECEEWAFYRGECQAGGE